MTRRGLKIWMIGGGLVWLALVMALVWLPLSGRSAQAQSDETAPCGTLGRIVTKPVVDPARLCPEYLIETLDDSASPAMGPNIPVDAAAAITSIAYAPTCDMLAEPRDWCGQLFFTRPDKGSLQWIGAFDSEARTYAIHTFATGLDTPNGLVWTDGAWIVAGDSTIYRLADDDGDNQADSVEVLLDDLPHDAGLWTNSISVGPDGALYLTKGASCPNCAESDPRRAALLRLEPDSGSVEVMLSGLYNAFDFAWDTASGDLWLTENGQPGLGNDAPLARLLRTDMLSGDYGWPACVQAAAGLTPNPLASQDAPPITCDEVPAPALTFPAHSAPAGLAFYVGDAFPDLQGDLLIVLSGGWNQPLSHGFALYRVCLDDAGDLTPCTTPDGAAIRDSAGDPASLERLTPVDVNFPDHSLPDLHIQGQSFYPEHPVDVAISPEGWIAISMMEGRIIRLRPAP